MQDEYQHRQSLVERGWADMEARLDKAMPVRGRNLNQYLLFLLIATVMLAGGVLAVKYLGKEEQKPAVKTVPVAELHGNKHPDDQTGVAGQDMASTDQFSSQLQNGQISRPYGDSPLTTYSEKQQTLSGNLKPEKHSRSLQLLSLEVSESERIPSKPSSIEKPEINSNVSVTRESLTYGTRTSEIVFFMPARPLSAISSLTIISSKRPSGISSIIEPVAMKTGKRGIAVSLTGGLHANADVLANGFDAGVMASLDISSRWAVESGLLFGHYAQDGLKLGASQADHSEFATSYPGNAGLDPVLLDFLSNEESYRIISDLSDKYSYLHLPVNARFKVTSKMTLVAGPRFSYLLNAITENAPELYNNFTQQWEPSGQNSNLIYRHDFLRKFETAAMVGLEFQVGRCTALELSYTHSFTHLVNKSSVPGRSDYLRTLRAGVEYQL